MFNQWGQITWIIRESETVFRKYYSFLFVVWKFASFLFAKDADDGRVPLAMFAKLHQTSPTLAMLRAFRSISKKIGKKIGAVEFLNGTMPSKAPKLKAQSSQPIVEVLVERNESLKWEPDTFPWLWNNWLSTHVWRPRKKCVKMPTQKRVDVVTLADVDDEDEEDLQSFRSECAKLLGSERSCWQ